VIQGAESGGSEGISKKKKNRGLDYTKGTYVKERRRGDGSCKKRTGPRNNERSQRKHAKDDQESHHFGAKEIVFERSPMNRCINCSKKKVGVETDECWSTRVERWGSGCPIRGKKGGKGDETTSVARNPEGKIERKHETQEILLERPRK